jgi:hypothetical protein
MACFTAIDAPTYWTNCWSWTASVVADGVEVDAGCGAMDAAAGSAA